MIFLPPPMTSNMSSAKDVNYKDNFFEKAELTKIIGEPTYDTLQTLLRELKANARSVHSNLGGGTYGHLGLVISPTTYAILSTTPFVRPTHPGTLTIPPGSTQHAARTLRELHEEALHEFHQVEGVDRALKQQIVAAIDPTYLIAIRDRTTNTIVRPVYEVLEYLFQTYGKVDPNTFSAKESEIKAITYDINSPIDNIFEQIEDLVDYSGHAGVPMTPEQSINIGYVIMWRTGALVDNLKEWNRKTTADKTWDNFKTHFCVAITNHRKLKGPTVHNSIYQANLINEIKTELRDTIAQELRTLTPPATVFTPTPTFTSPPPDDHLSNQLDHMANSISEYQRLLPQLIRQIQSLTTQVAHLQSSNPPSHISTDISSISTQQTVTKGNYIFPQKMSHYCWTHGLCNHNGNECRGPADGHKPEATFENRMGGNNRNCSRAKRK